MLRTLCIATCAAALFAGCASYDGRGLVERRANLAEVQSLMGAPAARVTRADGSTVLYYPRGPAGRESFGVTLGPDGIVRGIEQLLVRSNVDKLRAGSMTVKEVRELLGPPDPSFVTRLPRQARDVWEYKWMDYNAKHILAVQFSDDGILREVINYRDYENEVSGGDFE